MSPEITPEEIAQKLGGYIEGNFGMFDYRVSAEEFKLKMEDACYQVGPLRELQGKFMVPFITDDIDSACPVCGGEIYFDFPSRQWGHALRANIPFYKVIEEEDIVEDSLYMTNLIVEFLNAYYKPPEGYTWMDVKDHIPDCAFPDLPCEICARTTYGCPER